LMTHRCVEGLVNRSSPGSDDPFTFWVRKLQTRRDETSSSRDKTGRISSR
jgi:hypothetical protein